MRLRLVQSVLAAGLLAGCAGESSIKSAEVLDEHTGVTMSALQAPLEFVENGGNAGPGAARRPSFAYLGPLEWDRSGDITYGLWIHVAPGSDRPVGDIHATGAVTMTLDDRPLALSGLESPAAGSGPYRPVASWGQTGYYASDAGMLKRMSHSDKIRLEFRGTDGATVEFTPTRETRATLAKFAHARGITDD